MLRSARPSTIRKWTDRLRRFEQSGQTVSEFCRVESVSTASFYQWRRKLADQWRAQASGGTPLYASRGASTATGGTGDDRTAASFREIVLTGASQPTASLTVRLPDGIQLDIRSPLPTLEALVVNLLGHASASGEETVC